MTIAELASEYINHKYRKRFRLPPHTIYEEPFTVTPLGGLKIPGRYYPFDFQEITRVHVKNEEYWNSAFEDIGVERRYHADR
jgi:hypothetical protein